jgi:hypothetical protein
MFLSPLGEENLHWQRKSKYNMENYARGERPSWELPVGATVFGQIGDLLLLGKSDGVFYADAKGIPGVFRENDTIKGVFWDTVIVQAQEGWRIINPEKGNRIDYMTRLNKRGNQPKEDDINYDKKMLRAAEVCIRLLYFKEQQGRQEKSSAHSLSATMEQFRSGVESKGKIENEQDKRTKLKF